MTCQRKQDCALIGASTKKSCFTITVELSAPNPVLRRFIWTQKCVGLHCIIPLCFSGSPFICQSLSGGSWVIRSVWSWKENNPQIYVRVVFCFPFKHASCVSRISCRQCSSLGCRLQCATHKSGSPAVKFISPSSSLFPPMLPQISSMLQITQP